MKVYVLLGDTVGHKCPSAPGSPLEYRLGLREWIGRALRSVGDDDPIVFKDKDGAIGYNVEFAVEASLGVTPNFMLTRVEGKGALSAEGKATHTLDLGLADTGETYVPRVAVVRRVRKVVETRGVLPSGEPEVRVVTRPVTRRVLVKQPVGDITKLRLDNIVRELQLGQIGRRLR